MRTAIPYSQAEYNRINDEIENDKNRITDEGKVLFRSRKVRYISKLHYEKYQSILLGCTSLTTVSFPSVHRHSDNAIRLTSQM